MARRRARLTGVLCLSVALAAAPPLSAQTTRCRPGDPEVRRLEFYGNASISEAELARAIVTTPSSWPRRTVSLPIGTRRCFDRDELAKDRLRLILLYRTRGFPDVSVTADAHEVGSRAVNVSFRIIEGQPVILRSLVIIGAEGLPDSRSLLRRLPIRAGDRLDRAYLDAARDSIVLRLHNSGHPHGSARNVITEDRSTRTAVDTLFVSPGPLTRIVSIDVDVTPRPGHGQQIPAAVVRRIAGIRPGDVYREGALIDAQRTLYLTDAYRQVAVRVDTGGTTDSTASVTLLLAEDAMRAARLGAGYGTLDCFRATGELTDYNFLSGARRLELTARVSKIGIGEPLGGAGQLCPQARRDPYSSRLNYYVAATLRQPAFFGLRLVPSLTLYSARTSEFKAYLRTTTIGGIASVDWRRLRKLPATFAYQLDYGSTEAQPALFCAVFNRCDREERERLQARHRLGTLSATFSQSTTDDAFFPRYGGSWRFEVRHASAATLADSGLGFSKLVGDIARYWPAGPTVLAVRARAGGLFSPSFRTVDRFVPPEERLFAGGPTTVRGFPQNELGSSIYIASEFDTLFVGPDTLFRVHDAATGYRRAVPVGGNTLFVGNVELRMRSPILPDILQLTLFTDVGDVWNRGRTSVFRQIKLKATPGFQVGGTSPVGLIRMAIGYNPYGRPSGPIYYEQRGIEGGGLPCVSPGNTLKVHALQIDGSTVFQQEEGRCPVTFTPETRRSFRSRLTFSFAIGQAF